jgi:hypothetical protein
MDRGKAWIVVSSLLILLGLWATGLARADLDMKEGKWETTSEAVMEGMPYQMPAQKTTHCVTKKDMVPMRSEDKERCKIISQNIKGNTITYKMRCTDKDGTAEIEGESTYADNGASYKGNSSMKVTDKKGKTTNMKMKVAGRRIGECDAPGREQAPIASPERGVSPPVPGLQLDKSMGPDVSTSQAGEKPASPPVSAQDGAKDKPEKSATEKVLDAPVKGLKKLFGF